MTLHFNRREHALFFLCLAVIGAYLVNGLVLVPVRKESRRLDVQILKAQKDDLSDARLVNKGRAMAKQYGRFLARYRQKQSDEEVMATILKEIEETASRNGLSISDIKPNRPKPESDYKEFSVGLALEGDFAAIMRFVAFLQQDPYRYFVEDFDVSKNAPRRETVLCRMVLGRVLIP